MRWGHLPTGSGDKQPLPSAVEVNVMIPIWPMDQPIGNAASCTTCCPWSTGAGLAISTPWIRGHVDSQVGQVRGELLAVRGFRQLLELFEACVRGWGLCDHCQNHQQVEGAQNCCKSLHSDMMTFLPQNHTRRRSGAVDPCSALP